MNTNKPLSALQQDVRDFMTKAGQEMPSDPTIPPYDVRVGRLKWLAEELCELANAYGVEISLHNRNGATDQFTAQPALVPMYTDNLDAMEASFDANIDIIYFALGNAIAEGTELQPGWDHVHECNMSKFIDGYRRADGKWMKGPSTKKADNRPILLAQIASASKK